MALGVKEQQLPRRVLFRSGLESPQVGRDGEPDGSGAELEGLDPHARQPAADHVERLGRGPGEVDDAVGLEGTTVVDADLDAEAVGEVGHPQHGAER